MILHSGLSVGSSCWIISTIKYIMLSSTLRSVLSAREMAGFRTALLQAALLLEERMRSVCDSQLALLMLMLFMSCKLSEIILNLHVQQFHQSGESSYIQQQESIVPHPVLHLSLRATLGKGS